MEEAILFRREFLCEPQFCLNKEEVSHLKALRIFSEDKNLRILNGIGSEWIYEVKGNSRQGILKKTEVHVKPESISAIATAIPKGNRLEWLLQKGTELGLSRFYFLNFEQSDRRDFNLSRAQKIVEEASIQSKRIFLPEVFVPVSLNEFLNLQENLNLSIYQFDPKGKSEPKPEFFKIRFGLWDRKADFVKRKFVYYEKRIYSGLKRETLF